MQAAIEAWAAAVTSSPGGTPPTQTGSIETPPLALAQGIEDTFVVAEWAHPRANLKLRYDDYGTESGDSGDYGDELGAWLTVPVGKNYAVALKYARFDADGSPPPGAPRDTDKFWLMLSANF